jgi:hypothetical protein
VTPRSSPPCSAAPAKCSTRDAPDAPPTAPNAAPYAPCTAVVCSRTVRSGSRHAASITSNGGGATTEHPTSPTWCRSANGTITSSTKASGPCR